MERKELIATAKELGFTKAHTMKTVELEKIVNEQPKTEHVKGNGTGKTGRKINPNSERQKRLQAIQARIENGEEIKRGRPIVGESARQQRLKDLEERRLNGTLRRGRPKKQQEEEVSLINMLQEKGQ